MAYNIKLDGLELKTKNGEHILASDFKVEIKELDSENKTFWAIASSEAEDRDNDIVRVAGWDLKNYKKAPRGLFMHNYFEHPHFKTLNIKVDKKLKQLQFQPQFDTNYDKARITWNQYENGFLSDFSSGFIGKDFAWRDEENRWSGGREFTKQELIEISAVTVPANPEAQVMRNAGLILPDEISLLSMGYDSEFKLIEDKNEFWLPVIKHLEAFKDPKVIKLGNGIKVVNAVPKFKNTEKSIAAPVVGYFFDTNQFDQDKIKLWAEENNISTLKQKYYVIGFNEKDEIDINIEEVEEKLLTTLDIPEETDIIVNDLDNSEELHVELELDPVEDGCSKPKKSLITEDDFDFEGEIDFNEKDYDEIIEKSLITEEERPYPNEHACRIKDPDGFDKFARKNCAQKHNDKCIDVIYGIKDEKSTIQALRYKTKDWEAKDAKSHCESRNGTFEAAKPKKYSLVSTIKIGDIEQTFEFEFDSQEKLDAYIDGLKLNENIFADTNTEDQQTEIKTDEPIVDKIKIFVGDNYITLYCANEEDKEKMLQFFDKSNQVDVKELNDVLIEVKGVLEQVKSVLGEVKNFQKIEEDNREDIIELDFEKTVPPITDEQNSDDLIELSDETSSDEKKILEKEIPATIGNVFANIFKETLNKYSGKLDN